MKSLFLMTALALIACRGVQASGRLADAVEVASGVAEISEALPVLPPVRHGLGRCVESLGCAVGGDQRGAEPRTRRGGELVEGHIS